MPAREIRAVRIFRFLFAFVLIHAALAASAAHALLADGTGSPVATTAPDPPGGIRELWRAYEGGPPGGFSYRLTIGASAMPESPHRLVVWLHPSGSAANHLPESLLPTFVARGFALLVITRKQFSGWTDQEAATLLTKVLPDAAKTPGLDSRKPLLFGFSAGGQLALALWRAQPSRFGGIILDAAYPLDEEDGKQVLMNPPSGKGLDSVPLYAAVGADDPVAQVWKKVEPAWRDAGVPLTIRWVAGAKHDWVLTQAEIAALDEWLARLPAPSRTVPEPQEGPAPAARP